MKERRGAARHAATRIWHPTVPRGAVIVDAAIGHADPEAHFTSKLLPHLIAARTARATAP